jgi:hypothetical protein
MDPEHLSHITRTFHASLASCQTTYSVWMHQINSKLSKVIRFQKVFAVMLQILSPAHSSSCQVGLARTATLTSWCRFVCAPSYRSAVEIRARLFLALQETKWTKTSLSTQAMSAFSHYAQSADCPPLTLKDPTLLPVSTSSLLNMMTKMSPPRISQLIRQTALPPTKEFRSRKRERTLTALPRRRFKLNPISRRRIRTRTAPYLITTPTALS